MTKDFFGIPPAKIYNPTTRTYQVAYLETNQEVNQTPSSPIARNKIIRKWGGNYVSARKGEISPGYGPMPQSSSGNTFTLTIIISNPDRHYDYAFEACGSKFSTCKLDSVEKASEWARKLGNGEVKVVDTKHDNKRKTSYEKGIKKDIEKTISNFKKEELKEGEGRGYQLLYSEIS